MSYVYLVRHGETDWNRTHRIQGSSDIPLNDTGRAQAARTAALLARRQWDAIYSSPLSRAFETATITDSTTPDWYEEIVNSCSVIRAPLPFLGGNPERKWRHG